VKVPHPILLLFVCVCGISPVILGLLCESDVFFHFYLMKQVQRTLSKKIIVPISETSVQIKGGKNQGS
jgi:hypothetical protein